MGIHSLGRGHLIGIVAVATAADASLAWAGSWWWDGGAGITDRRWSNPLNWDRDTVPSPFAHVAMTEWLGNTLLQNLGPFNIDGLHFAGGSSLQISGDPLIFTGGASLGSASNQRSRINAPIVLQGRLTLYGYIPFTPTSGLGLLDLSGPGSLLVDNSAGAIVPFTIGTATYTGTTVVNSGVLRVGGYVSSSSTVAPLVGQTSGQGSYQINPNGVISGNGTIGLAGGARVFVNGGTIAPGTGALAPDAPTTLTIGGDVVFDPTAGGTLEIDINDTGAAPLADRLVIGGMLDLSGGSDSLHMFGQSHGLPLVVAEYASRVGEFDLITPGYLVTYTSPPNAGPGQVVIQIPEPVGLATVALVAGAPALLRRSRCGR